MESGQSQFAPLKLRSLALVPSSGALPRPSELHSWQLHCKILPAAPRRSGQKLAAVPCQMIIFVHLTDITDAPFGPMEPGSRFLAHTVLHPENGHRRFP